ncbi:MAG: hypothetical protein COA62_10865 [Rhodobiaceae bacterium]|nr:MAG: hypothetical protein COA62_10865 [Rhodobiaceae bacterium]
MDQDIPTIKAAETASDMVSQTPPAAAFDFGSVLDLLSAGGPVLYLLAGLSLVTAALVFAKMLQFSSARLGEKTKRGALARVRAAAQTAAETAEGDRTLIEDAGLRAARAVMRPLESSLGALGMIAVLSPLIGLLGTVIGMIDAFRALNEAGSTVDPSILSGGIWIALLTTAAGLIVAIPATVAHGWFEGRLGRFADLAETVIGELAAAMRTRSGAHLRVAAD